MNAACCCARSGAGDNVRAVTYGELQHSSNLSRNWSNGQAGAGLKERGRILMLLVIIITKTSQYQMQKVVFTEIHNTLCSEWFSLAIQG